MMAQKPYDRTYLNNMIKHNIGLFNTKVKVGNNKFPSNLLTVENINEQGMAWLIIEIDVIRTILYAGIDYKTVKKRINIILKYLVNKIEEKIEIEH